ncbi:MAG: PBP1A family penicillin-binding protein [Azoarcus sp.]|jgi:penicillin-binding protein 1A|nr:PBP1A family penicillin-binding protein [Azoarcus sp.]
MQLQKRWIIYSIAALFALVVIGVATLVTVSVLIWPKLPPLDALTDYRPRVPLRVYTADGYLIKEIGEERRAVVKIENVPAILKNALIAAEDEHFYEHKGFVPKAIVRATLANLLGRRKQGASTITQQVAKNFFLTFDRSLVRKLYELLLALKIERNLSKDKILELYINQIYLGQRAYGFEVAAQTYFGKTLANLSLAEAAMLAGLPQAPSSGNPIANPTRAQKRQRYVLRRMLTVGFINEEQYNQALAEPLKTTGGSAARDPSVLSPVHAEYVAEIARQIAVGQYGEQATSAGIKIVTTITRAEQEAAYEAVRAGIMRYDRDHGYRGPEKYIVLPDGNLNEDQLDDELAKAAEEDKQLRDYDDMLLAVVTATAAKEVTVYRNSQFIKISGDGLRLAAQQLADNAPKRVRRGALVRIRNIGEKGWEITQLPEIDAALISIDSRSGAVRALVGGFDFNRNQFNNVTMARRQPGSGFKPFIYSAALEKGYAPGTMLVDEPLYYPQGVTGSAAWEPHNYDNKFSGLMTLRDALVHSKNIPAIRVLEDITPQYAQSYLANFGFDTSRHPPYLTMALGAGAASPWEMATGYAVFANGGYRINPYVVKEILDVNGKTLARVDPPVAGESAPRVIDARNAWIMDSMLHDVVRRGTGVKANTLRRSDLAGKTGTTNDWVDAWFCGYNPQVVAIVWFGYPIPRNMGKSATGGGAALPIWIDYMRYALNGMPETALPRPAGIASAPVDNGEREDYYYADGKPPELRPLEDDLLRDLMNTPTNAENYMPPAPVPQSNQGDMPLPPLPTQNQPLPPMPLPMPVPRP